MFFKGSLESACIYLSFEKPDWQNFENSGNGAPFYFCFFEIRNVFSAQVLFKIIFLYGKGSANVRWWLYGNRWDIPFIWKIPIEKTLRTPEVVRTSIMAFSKNVPFFSASFVQMKYSLRKGIRKCSLKARWKALGYTFPLKETDWQNFDISGNDAPLYFCCFETRNVFSAKVFFKWIFLYEKGSENVLYWLFGNRLDIPFIQNNPLAKLMRNAELVPAQFWHCWKPSRFFSARLVQRYFSLRKGFSKGSLMAL